MSTTANALTNPAVSASGEVDTLLIEKFTGKVHEQYQKGENLLRYFDTGKVVGTNMISNKYIGETQLQKLIPGQDPEATPTDFDKNALVVDTILLARNAVQQLHDVQSDIETKGRLANNQMGQLKSFEDKMVLQQGMKGALTGGVYDPYAAAGSKITGGIRRVTGQGVAINTVISPTQAASAYHLYSALEISIMGLVHQKVPLRALVAIMSIEDFGTLVDMGLIATMDGGMGTGFEGSDYGTLTGRIKTTGTLVHGSAEFSELKENGVEGVGEVPHNFLSNEGNGFRYDVTAEMLDANALIFGRSGLLTGKTLDVQGDIYFDKKTKSYFIDTWMSEGAIPDRYDNLAIVRTVDAADNDAVNTKAENKAKLTRTVA